MATYKFFKNHKDITNSKEEWDGYDKIMIESLIDTLEGKQNLKDRIGEFTFVINHKLIFPIYLAHPSEKINSETFTHLDAYLIHETINRVNQLYLAQDKK